MSEMNVNDIDSYPLCLLGCRPNFKNEYKYEYIASDEIMRVAVSFERKSISLISRIPYHVCLVRE